MRKLFVPAVVVLIAGLALLGCERKITNEDAGNPSEVSCFTCHSDNNFDFVAAQQEYANSIHGSGNNIDRNTDPCRDCHASEGFLAKLAGETPNGDHYTAITCFTCHAPHTNGNLSLRAEGPYTLQDGSVFDYGKGNLCVRCHHSRQDVRSYVIDNVKLSSRWGPHHSDQGDILAGAGGYEYAGYTYQVSPHTGVLTDGCIQCHMEGSWANKTGGHTWNMADEESDHEHLTGCNVDACHGTTGPLTTFNRTAAEDFDGDGTIEGVQDEISGLLADLGALLTTKGLMAVSGEGYAPKSVTVTDSDSAGAVYNYMVIAEERSLGIHNTKYAVGLLKSGMNFISTGDPNGSAPQPQIKELVSAH
jgi:hypothetical protein